MIYEYDIEIKDSGYHNIHLIFKDEFAYDNMKKLVDIFCEASNADDLSLTITSLKGGEDGNTV